jgi:hypothetical protein
MQCEELHFRSARPVLASLSHRGDTMSYLANAPLLAAGYEAVGTESRSGVGRRSALDLISPPGRADIPTLRQACPAATIHRAAPAQKMALCGSPHEGNLNFVDYLSSAFLKPRPSSPRSGLFLGSVRASGVGLNCYSGLLGARNWELIQPFQLGFSTRGRGWMAWAQAE